ncbi:uncharacterized protein LOC122685226 [Cervus elaphus]|uniref:uncharacterized protein LOC122685226 n=1 Tax=Cervus elaphus TaxID=9860 RepID=UPI001CC2D05A|nr:uncharacterized protein LOC122685226 [Cervus elaphus]
MFCCLPLPRGRGLGRAHRQSVWDRWRRWLRAPRGGLWPFARRNRKSFPPDVADEGDTPSTSSREGSEPHPPAREAQCRVQPRAPLPLRQHEDLEPSAAEHRALALTFQLNQAPFPTPVPTEVLAARAGPRDPLRGHRDLIHPASKTLGQLVPGHHTGQIGPLCLQDAQPQAPMSLPLGPNVHLHLHLHLLGLWQENPSQGMSYHLCRESLPWLLLNTQTPTMTNQPLQGQRAPLLDRDPEPVLETPGPGEPSQEELRVHTGNGRSQPLGSAAPSSSGWRLCPDGSWKATNRPRPTSLPFHCWSLTTASRTPSGRTRAPLPLDSRVKPGPGS